MDRTRRDVSALQVGLVFIPFKATILGNTTPVNGTFTVVEGKEAIASFTRTGTGEYRLTFKDRFKALVSQNYDLAAHGGAARQIVPGAVDLANKRVDFTVTTEALVAGDTPNSETDTVYGLIVFRNSTVGS